MKKLLLAAVAFFLTSCSTSDTEVPATSSISGGCGPMHGLINIDGPHSFYCIPEDSRGETDSRAIYGYQNRGMLLKCSEIPALQRHGLQGDPTAARALAQFFKFTDSFEEGVYWDVIAAENGSLAAMHDLAYYYDLSQKPEYKLRAKYWKNKFIALSKSQNRKPGKLVSDKLQWDTCMKETLVNVDKIKKCNDFDP